MDGDKQEVFGKKIGKVYNRIKKLGIEFKEVDFDDVEVDVRKLILYFVKWECVVLDEVSLSF